MRKTVPVVGLLVALLLLAACAPAETDVVTEEMGGLEDVDVLVYASPL